jgi:hypothetical protein
VYRWGRGELDDAAEKKPGGVPGVVPGRWLGPCVTAQAMAALTNARRPGGMCAYVLADEDGTFGGGAPNLDARKVAAFASEKASQLRGFAFQTETVRLRNGPVSVFPARRSTRARRTR